MRDVQPDQRGSIDCGVRLTSDGDHLIFQGRSSDSIPSTNQRLYGLQYTVFPSIAPAVTNPLVIALSMRSRRACALILQGSLSTKKHASPSQPRDRALSTLDDIALTSVGTADRNKARFGYSFLTHFASELQSTSESQTATCTCSVLRAELFSFIVLRT